MLQVCQERASRPPTAKEKIQIRLQQRRKAREQRELQGQVKIDGTDVKGAPASAADATQQAPAADAWDMDEVLASLGVDSTGR